MVVTKRFVSDPSVLVDTALDACVALQPGLCLDSAARVVYRPPIFDSPRVTLLSGGGSGHEPGHAGYVAEGMLDAAVSGPIFASPNAQHIRTGLRHIASPKGTLVIVKNYTGDRLNFGLATELSRAYDGRDIETVTVQDDVSVPRSCCGVVGRRGLAGVVLVHKIAGASAAEGKSLPQVAAIARAVADRIATIGVSVEGCSIPGAPRSRQVDCDVLELGMGIHNEPGTRKLETDISTAELISTLLSTLLDENNPERGFLKRDEDSETVLLINNLGGLSKLELLSLTDYVLLALKSEYGISPCRVFSGTYLSSLDGSGFSITLFSLPNGVQGMDLLRLLDAPTKSVNWQHASPNPSTQRINSPLADNAGNDVTSVLASAQAAISYDQSLLHRILVRVDSSLRSAEPEITHFDMHLGDGDCGTTLLAGSSGLVNAFTISPDDPSGPSDFVSDVQRLTTILGSQMGGTSGALYSIFFSGFANSVQQQLKLDPNMRLSLHVFSKALGGGLVAMRRYTSAGVGDRTMMDALIPFVEKIQQCASNQSIPAFEAALEAAKEGCEHTRHQRSRYGRSTYVGAASTVELEADSMPDPGACGIVAIVQGVLTALMDRH